MKIAILLPCVLSLMAGCKSGASKSSTAEQRQYSTQSVTGLQTAVQVPREQEVVEWKPVSKGAPYQLTLKSGTLAFCDDTGPRQVDLRNGEQTAGPSTCDRKNDAIKNGCGDQVDIVGSADGPYDTVSVERYSFRLHGHVRDCDRDGNLVIVSTTGEIALMDAAANRIAFVKADLPDTVVIGSGWAAWNSQNRKAPLRLEKTSALLRQAITPHDD